jgi:hypothetical protein
MKIYKLFLFVNFICLGLLMAQEESKQEAAKPKALDEMIAPEAIISPEAFIFQSVTIPLFAKKQYAYLIFELEIQRAEGDSKAKERQRDDLPVIVDTLITDLTPALEVFWDGKADIISAALQRRISRLLKAKFGWIEGIAVSKVRIQAIQKPSPPRAKAVEDE